MIDLELKNKEKVSLKTNLTTKRLSLMVKIRQLLFIHFFIVIIVHAFQELVPYNKHACICHIDDEKL
jgi:hypothetical protein